MLAFKIVTRLSKMEKQLIDYMAIMPKTGVALKRDTLLDGGWLETASLIDCIRNDEILIGMKGAVLDIMAG